jgi:hypothetical protein
MKTISHRGNINGICDLENNPDHIRYLLNKNIDCEVDVWYIGNAFYLGHDFGQYQIDIGFLKQGGLWCHAKNLEALNLMLSNNINCFWHQNDDFSLTSGGFIWTFIDKPLCSRSIIVDNSIDWRLKNYNCWAVCTDYI